MSASGEQMVSSWRRCERHGGVERRMTKQVGDQLLPGLAARRSDTVVSAAAAGRTWATGGNTASGTAVGRPAALLYRQRVRPPVNTVVSSGGTLSNYDGTLVGTTVQSWRLGVRRSSGMTSGTVVQSGGSEDLEGSVMASGLVAGSGASW